MPERAIPTTPGERKLQARVLTGLRTERQSQAANRRDWDLTRVAAKIGVSASSLSRYESGDVILPTNYLRLVAEAYGVPVGNLLAHLGLVDEPGAVLRARLTGRIPQDELERQVQEHGERSPEAQHDIA